jgi:hypothetical protein
MCKAILECRRVDEVAKLQDDVKRQLYGQQVKDGNTMKAALNEIYIRAERQLGELLAALPRAPTRSRYDTGLGRDTRLNPESKQKVMADNGITKDRASKAERIARIPKAEFEQEVVKPKASIRRLADYARSKEPPKPKKPEPKWYDPHLDSKVRLTEGLERIEQGLKMAILGLKIKDLILARMQDQGTELPEVMHRLNRIRKHMEALTFICPCPLRNQKAITQQVKETIDA